MKISFSAILVVLMLFFAGCQSQDEKATPDDTRPIGGPGTGEAGWLDDTSVYGDPAAGLEARSVSMDGTGGLAPSTQFPQGIVGSIFFGFDQYSITPAERPKVVAAADYLSANPGSQLVLEGHTDWYGTEEYNLGLADRRAMAVKDYLVTLGVNPARVEVLALGETEADQGMAKTDPAVVDDRRVDMIVME